MSPDETKPTAPDTPLPEQRGTPSIPQRPEQQQAAARVIKTQVDALYDAQDLAAAQQTEQQANPYDRTHTDHPQPELDQWKEYHTAWQNYYQKYYEGYYTHHLHHATQALNTQHSQITGQTYFTHQEPEQHDEQVVTKDEALYDLRQKLLTKVQTSATKVRRSRHFVPISAAVIVVLVFVFLQYNRVFISNVTAYVTPGSIDPQNIVVDPTADIKVGPESRLIIPKINVDVPVIYDVGSDYESQMKAMEKGVAHFAIPGASSRPGQVGNTAIAGHSSNDIFDIGDYKFIFAQLEKLTIGDTIYANYKGTRYTYTITKTETVKPTDVDKLIYPTTKPVMTLITCTPLGTALNRFLVTAEQVSPDPSASSAAPTPAAQETADIPGNSPTFLERLFGN